MCDIPPVFKERNPHCEITVNETELLVDKPFGSNDSQLCFPISDSEIRTILEHISFKPQFDAIFHHDTNSIEFVFSYLDPKSKRSQGYIDRSFQFACGGLTHTCSFAEPTSRLFKIAAAFKRISTNEGNNAGFQLSEFRDAQRLEKLPERAKIYFEGRVPRSFFVHLSCPIEQVNIASLAGQINFLMEYYDRQTPQIEIRREQEEKEERIKGPLRYISDSFPNNLIARPADEVTLKLLQVASASEPRIAYLYYYQIFEYAGFHYIDAKAKSAMMKVLRDPAIVDNLALRIGDIFTTLSDVAHNDDVRMKKVVEELCDASILWKEIAHDKHFFSSDVDFVGGFRLSALISADLSEEGWTKMWHPKLFDHLTKMRNCLVHARERRESKVILPDKENDNRIGRYLPLLRRMGEQIAIGGNNF
jgi:hypothetical protein